MAALLLSGLAAWIYGKWGGVVNSKKVRLMAAVSTIIVITGGIVFANSFVQNEYQNSSDLSVYNTGLNWEKFSEQRLNELINENKPVFIDFTAAWCLSCQVNEKIALNNTEVLNKFEELSVITLKADWTTRNPAITEALAKFGRNSVPLYVLYNGSKESPKLLPEILTPGIVLEELNKL
jgi:thiol:disulfide interchange protein DsbD